MNWVNFGFWDTWWEKSRPILLPGAVFGAFIHKHQRLLYLRAGGRSLQRYRKTHMWKRDIRPKWIFELYKRKVRKTKKKTDVATDGRAKDGANFRSELYCWLNKIFTFPHIVIIYSYQHFRIQFEMFYELKKWTNRRFRTDRFIRKSIFQI